MCSLRAPESNGRASRAMQHEAVTMPEACAAGRARATSRCQRRPRAEPGGDEPGGDEPGGDEPGMGSLGVDGACELGDPDALERSCSSSPSSSMRRSSA